MQALNSFLGELEIGLIDIGASGGLEPRWRSIRHNIKAFLFEPDERSHQELGSADYVEEIFPVALGASETNATLSGLDPVNRRLLSSVVRQLKENGTTILFSTHQMEQAEDLCDQVLLVHKGEKVLDETMNQIHGRFDPRTILAEPSNSIEAATQALQNVADIESFRWSVEQKAFEIRVAQGVDTQLAMASVMRATPLRRVELQRATLDDVFVTLVGGSVGEIESAQKSGKLQATHD